MNKKLLILLLFAFLVRLIYVYPTRNNIVYSDENGYVESARNIAKGIGNYSDGHPQSFRMPLFINLLGYSMMIFGENIFLLKIFQIFFSVLMILFVYIFMRKYFDEKTAIITSLFFSIYPYFIFYTRILMYETILALITSVILILTSNILIKRKILDFIIIGVFIGLIHLIKPFGNLFFFVLFITLFFFIKEKLKIKFLYFMTSFIAFFIIVLPWGIRNYKIFNSFFIGSTQGGSALLVATKYFDYEFAGEMGYIYQNSEDFKKMRILGDVEGNKYAIKVAKKYMLNNKKRIIKLAVKKFFMFWRLYPHENKTYVENKNIIIIISSISESFLIIMAIYGFIIYLIKKRNLILIPHFIFILLLTFVHMIFYASIRYRFPLMPSLIIFSSLGFVEIFDKLINYKKIN